MVEMFLFKVALWITNIDREKYIFPYVNIDRTAYKVTNGPVTHVIQLYIKVNKTSNSLSTVIIIPTSMINKICETTFIFSKK